MGATWGADGTIIFATTNVTTGLQRIAAAGGEPTVLTRPNREGGEADHLWPAFLPGGQAVLFTITATTGGLDQAQVVVLDLRTGTQTVLIRGGSDAHYVSSGPPTRAEAKRPSGLRCGGDAACRRLRPRPARCRRHARAGPPAGADDADRRRGRGGGGGWDAGLRARAACRRAAHGAAWCGWTGRARRRRCPRRRAPTTIRGCHRMARASRSQSTIRNSTSGCGIWAARRLRASPSTRGSTATRSGRPIAASSSSAPSGRGERNLFAQAADGTGAITRLTESPNTQYPTSVSPDGTRLVFTDFAVPAGADVMQLRLDGTHAVTPLVQTPFTERNGEVSPDGRWLAYEANDSGRVEIYVRPFPDVTSGHWQVSTDGGTRPLWARNGQELFYLTPTGALMRVDVAGGPTWMATAPTKLFEGRYGAAACLRRPDVRRVARRPAVSDDQAGRRPRTRPAPRPASSSFSTGSRS